MSNTQPTRLGQDPWSSIARSDGLLGKLDIIEDDEYVHTIYQVEIAQPRKKCWLHDRGNWAVS